MRAAVFLDRDGVIIENRADYVKSWSEVELLDGAMAALRRLAASPMAIVIVTNQRAVARGIISHEQAWQLHRRMVAEIRRRGGRIDGSYICPHRDEDHCSCRKPAPGMLYQAAEELGLDLHQSWLVGDALSDLQAARRAGVRSILVQTGRGIEQQSLIPESEANQWPVAANLAAAAQIILAETENQT